MKVAVLDKPDYGKGGIDTFIRNVNPYLINNFKDTERVEFPEIRDWYPLSNTIEKLALKNQLENMLDGYDKAFVPSQAMMHFDPGNISTQVVPYIHDILPVTTCYRRYSDDSLIDRMDGYLASVMANRYMKFLAKTGEAMAASEVTKKDVQRRTAFKGEIKAVRQGVDHLPENQPVKNSDRDIDLLYVGGTLDRKNPEMIRKSMKKAEANGFNVAWVNFEEKDLPGTGYVDVSNKRLAEIYIRTRYYLHPSFAEGMGRGPLEAQRYGAIPLAKDIPINQEFLGRKGDTWRSISTEQDVVTALSSGCEEEREAARRNSQNYCWQDTCENVAEVLNLR